MHGPTWFTVSWSDSSPGASRTSSAPSLACPWRSTMSSMRTEEENATGEFDSGPCRARTDDIHGVNVALYQLS